MLWDFPALNLSAEVPLFKENHFKEHENQREIKSYNAFIQKTMLNKIKLQKLSKIKRIKSKSGNKW